MIPNYRAFNKETKTMHDVLGLMYGEIDHKGWDQKFISTGEIAGICVETTLENRCVGHGDFMNFVRPVWKDSKNFILMQSTGLKDKNGVEIFEFDLVDHYGEAFVVIYENGSFIIKGISYRTNPVDGEPYLIGDDLLINRVDVLEVIDNDPEFNPELLEQEHENKES